VNRVLCYTTVSRVSTCRRQCHRLTLSHWSIPRLVLFPPFCISLSFPRDTALNAKNCRPASVWLQWPVAPITHARHNGIGQQSLEWDTHDCGRVFSRGGVAGWVIGDCELEWRPRRLWRWPCEGLGSTPTYAKGVISDDELASPTPATYE
jgi:hypothetical protein